MISPTVGRVVLFVPAESKHDFGFSINAGRPHKAEVCYVHSDRMVNLSICDANGKQFSRTSITLRQPEDPVPQGDYCEWMPYQIATAK
jgi:hypothetical protein